MSEALQPADSSSHVMNQSDRDCRRVFFLTQYSSKIVVFVAVDGCSSDGRQTWMQTNPFCVINVFHRAFVRCNQPFTSKFCRPDP